MKPIAMQLLVLASLGLAQIAVAREVEPPVPVNLDNVPSHLRARIADKAREGLPALRRYLQVTQGIHGVRIENVVRWEEYEAMAKAAREETKVADGGRKAMK